VAADEEEDDGEEAAANGSGGLVRSESVVSSAAFWDRLLRPHHELLQLAEQVSIVTGECDLLVWSAERGPQDYITAQKGTFR
jgi:hypothetical protein